MLYEGFMYICKDRRTENCHPDVSNWSYPQQIENGENISPRPEGEELKSLDEICKECGRYLKIEEKNCPLCGDENIQFLTEHQVNAQPIYDYRCIKCRSKSFSYKKFD